MIEAIEVAIHKGEIICGFPTREQCKEYIKRMHSDIDPFDVELKTQYLSSYSQSNDYFNR